MLDMVDSQSASALTFDAGLSSLVVSHLLRGRRRLTRAIPRVLSRHALPWLPLPLVTTLPTVLFALLFMLFVTLLVQNFRVDELQIPSMSSPDGRVFHRSPRSAAVDNQSSVNDSIHESSFGSTEVSGYLEVVTPLNSTASSWPPTSTSRVEFRSYGGGTVDLRILVLAYNRPDSLKECLDAINDAQYDTADRVSLHVWIDGRRSNGSNIDGSDVEDASCAETIDVANAFNFTRGSYHVHVRASHVGVQGQWMTVWRPSPVIGEGHHHEVALIVEDDITVSPFYWRWLRTVHRAYGDRADVSGFSVSHPEMQHATGSSLEVPVNYTVFMYPVICTWGFSPSPLSWPQFQDWFFSVIISNSSNHTTKSSSTPPPPLSPSPSQSSPPPPATSSSSASASPAVSLPVPLIAGILPTEWYISERKSGREANLWEQWHIYFTHSRRQFTVIANPGPRVGLLAVNRHEKGLHDGRYGVVGATQPLATEWSERFEHLPDAVVKLGYDGVPLRPQSND